MVDARVDAPRPIDAPPPDADVTPPAVFQTMPAAGATNVPVSTTIRVQFTEAVFGVDLTTFVVSGTGVTGGTVSQVDPLDYTYTPDAALPPDTLISVELRSGIHDAAGNSLAFTGFNFQTAP
jgi:hypothetical protein